METLTCIAHRHSTRAYKGEAIEPAILEKIIDAARLAPTARNEQTWEFIVVVDPETRRRMAELTDGNGKFIAEAGACVAVYCRDTKYFLEDGAAATTTLIIAATALNVQSCWVAGDKKSYAAPITALLGVPADYKLVSLVALGKEAGAAKPRHKRPLNEVLHWDRF